VLDEAALGKLRAAEAEAKAQSGRAAADVGRAQREVETPLAGLDPERAAVGGLARTSRALDDYLPAAAEAVCRPPAEAARNLRRLWPRA
jgi:hypothetical protein